MKNFKNVSINGYIVAILLMRNVQERDQERWQALVMKDASQIYTKILFRLSNLRQILNFTPWECQKTFWHFEGF